jgi:hypothetical protein
MCGDRLETERLILGSRRLSHDGQRRASIWTGRKHGDSPLCPRGDGEACVCGRRAVALGQSGQSPCFRALAGRGRIGNGVCGRGENMGTARSVHAATERLGVCGRRVVALGQRGQSPGFRRLVGRGGIGNGVCGWGENMGTARSVHAATERLGRLREACGRLGIERAVPTFLQTSRPWPNRERRLWTGRKHGDSPLSPRGDEEACVCGRRVVALGQSGQSPRFRALFHGCCFQREGKSR